MNRILSIATAVVLFVALPGSGAEPQKPPEFEVDATWPSIPNNWVLGEVSSITVDPRDHIWVLHRPLSIPIR